MKPKRIPKPLPKPIQNALDAYATEYYMSDQGTPDQAASAAKAWLKAEKSLRRYLSRKATTINLWV